MKKCITLLFFLACFSSAFSQKGKNGAGNILVSTIVNAYTSLIADAFIGNTSLNVSSGSGYSAGDLVYIIQIQGASVNCYINPWGNPNSAEPYSQAFGKITNYNNAGNNEYAQIASVSGNIITIDCPLKNNYTAAGKVQVVKVPRYTSLTIATTGIITCPNWNGTTGGVIAIEVDGNTLINTGGKIDASGLGFRGGAAIGKTGGLLGGGAWGNNNPNEGAYKGESIAGDVLTYSVNFQSPYCKGAVANGGGGGNANNTGGGGGANAGDTLLYTGTGNPDISLAGYVTAWNLESPGFATSSSSGGGRGGYSFSSSNTSPITTGPNLAAWAGDNRRVQGGIGGRPLDYNTGRLFFGGGGGAGDENDAYGGSGGDGGGIINIVSYGTISGNGQILANGENGFNSVTSGSTPFNNCNGRDGAGGAGGGGAIVLNSTSAISGISVAAKGGNGGNQQMKSGFLTNTAMAYGPGGGGGGGYIGTTAAAITTFVNGGANGIVQYLSGNENCQIDNLFPSNGSTIGGSGTLTSTLLVIPTITTSPDVTICINNSAVVTATAIGTSATIDWYSAAAGGALLGTGSAFTTSVFSTPGSYTVFAGFCPDGTFRDPVIITVTTGPTITATSATVCLGQSATLTASGASSYTWNTGSIGPALSDAPLLTTVYTVTGSIGSCTNSTTASITVNPSGSISVTSATICNGQSANLFAGTALSFTWSTGASTQSISINPISTTVYTVAATLLSGCNVTNTGTVTVNVSPTITVNSASICAGETITLTASGAINYLWSDGATTSTNALTPNTTTVYTITGTAASCSSAATTTIMVTPIPTLSATSATICNGQVGSLTASGANSYTWDPFPGSNFVGTTFTASPIATTVYTLIGSINSCTAGITASIVVGANLSITVNTPTICSGQTATLSAISTATSYTWSSGGNTASIFVAPLVNSNYTVTGSKGACTGTAIANVIVNVAPSISINATPICTGQIATLTASGANTYSWSNGINNSYSISAAPLTNTNYTVIGETNSCTVASIYNLTITPSPTILVTNATICNGSTATLNATGATSYTWLPVGIQNNSISVTPSVSTTYTVIGDNGTCSSQAIGSITVNSNLIAPINSATICEGQTVIIGTSLSGSSYLWSNGATTQSITISPLSTTNYSLLIGAGSCSYTGKTTVSVTPIPIISLTSASICAGSSAMLSATGSTGNYIWNPGNLTGVSVSLSPTITTNYIVTSYNGLCPGTASTQVVVNQSPVLTISQTADLVCPNTPVTFSASGANIYEWYVNGLYYFGNPLTVTSKKTSIVTLVGTNGNCAKTNTLTLLVSDVSASFIAESNFVDYPGSLTFTNTSTGATTGIWNFGNGQTSNNTIATAYFDYPGKYITSLLVENDNGCFDTTSYVIEVGCRQGDFYIPNTFTPNGDGLNDMLLVIGGSCVTQFKGLIFDRWGTKVFKWESIEDAWDGNHSGKQVELGVYTYLVTYTLFNGKTFSKTGHIAVVR